MKTYLDYSDGKISGAAIKAAGHSGVLRYIDSPDRLSTKHTNLAEYNDHLANGLAVLLVIEVTPNDSAGGRANGIALAQRAKAGADYLGYKGLIFFTNDQPNLVNTANWIAFLDGAASILGYNRVGAYGFANAINAAQGHASAFWQSGRQADVTQYTHFYQWNNGNTKVNGITADINYVYQDFPVATLAPKPKNLEDQMQIPAAPTVTAISFALPGQACKIVVTPGINVADGTPNTLFLSQIHLSTDYNDDLLTLTSSQGVDPAGVAHMTKPEHFTSHPDALKAVMTYSSAVPFNVLVVLL
jgi:hypothetical protein